MYGGIRTLTAAMLALGGCYTGVGVDAGQLSATGGDDAGDAGDAGDDDGGDDSGGETGEDSMEPEGDHLAQIGLRRLSAHEYDKSVEFLLGALETSSEGVLPADLPDEEEDFPFETNYESQIVSNTLITAAESLAQAHIEALLADPQRRDAVVGCTPTGTQDATCMRSFIEQFGRRALRRPLSEEEITQYLELQTCSGFANDDCGFATDADDFYEGVAAVVASMLVSPRFLFRVEVGTPVPGEPGVHRLDAFEVASRLSFFLWGTTPDDALLNRAALGALNDADGVRETARWMLEDDRAPVHFARFHAAWIGYLQSKRDDGLAESMRQESDALVRRILFDEQRPWSELFTFNETFVDDQLAELYGIPSPGELGPGWVQLPPESGRAGLLGHGSVLAIGSKDSYATRPTDRGYRLSTMVLCQPVPPPPPDAPTDTSDAEGECKTEKVEAHAQGTCFGCHQYMDGLGLGLEAYDGLGRLREYEIEDPNCEIDPKGSFPPMGGQPAKPFSTPAELGQLMAESEQVQACGITQMIRFAVSRTIRRPGVKEGIHEEDVRLIDELVETLGKDVRFGDLVLEIVSSPFFLHRVEY